jgi:hypothetical protein
MNRWVRVLRQAAANRFLRVHNRRLRELPDGTLQLLVYVDDWKEIPFGRPPRIDAEVVYQIRQPFEIRNGHKRKAA